MEAQRTRNIKSGAEYDHMFPKAEVGNHTILKRAGVSDTCSFIPKVVNKTLSQTKAIAQKLKGADTYQTCRNIWHFVYEHIAYRKDEEGYEQIRSPARAWHDRKRGVDCDCYSTFISSTLTNLGIEHSLRITKYHRDYFQHIYPIVHLPNGKYITVDCVTDKFDYEVPFSEKKDYRMELQFLNGIDGIGAVDYELAGDGIMELGKLAKKKKAAGGGTTKKQARQAKKAAKKAAKNDPNAPKKKKGLKKLLNVVNKVNPATLALRNGVLAAMKLNIGKIGSRLRWSYLSPADAAKKNIDPERFKKLVAARQKLENIFYNAGGKPENMKKAILKGKGNKDKQVKGLDGIDYEALAALDYVDINSPLSAVLGAAIFHSENIEGMEGMEGFGELGEPVTLATVAAASGVIATIAGMLKKIGDIFKGKGDGSGDFSAEEAAQGEQEAAQVSSGSGSSTELTTTGSGSGESTPATTTDDSSGGSEDSGVDGSKSPATVAKTTGDDGGGDDSEGFFAKHKKWLIPAAVGVGGLAVLAIAMGMKKPSETSSSTRSSGKGLNGTPRRKSHKRKPTKNRKNKGKIKAVRF